MRPGTLSEEQYLNLTWELLSYDSQFIFIQLEFEHPSRISSSQYYDTLEVHFWGNDFFKSAEDGEPVRYGAMLEHKIVRQVSPKTGRRLSAIANVLACLIWTVCLFAIILTGRLLPTWIFLNSL